MTPLAGPPVRRRCGRCGALGPVVDARAPLAGCGACGAAPTTGDRIARFGAEHWVATLLILAVVVLGGLGWWQTRPTGPADPRPVTDRSQLSDDHGCRIPRLWQVGEPVGGALVGSDRPDRPALIAWVPAGQVARWQPDWTLREWCTR